MDKVAPDKVAILGRFPWNPGQNRSRQDEKFHP